MSKELEKLFKSIEIDEYESLISNSQIVKKLMQESYDIGKDEGYDDGYDEGYQLCMKENSFEESDFDEEEAFRSAVEERVGSVLDEERESAWSGGHSDGYDEGYEEARNEWYEKGYNDGFNDGNDEASA